MKKVYTIPSIEIVKIDTLKMVAGSLDASSGTGSVYEEQVTESTPGESRSVNFWDDEEE